MMTVNLRPEIIMTNRLELRPVSLNEFEFIKSLQTNPKIMASIGPGAVRTPTQIQDSLDFYFNLRKENPLLGQWVIREKSLQKDIGAFILRPPATQEKLEGIEIGYTFTPETWGKGYATEAAGGVIDYTLRKLPRVRILALVDNGNEASKKVLSKVGMKPIGQMMYVNPITGEKKECLLLQYA